MGLPTDFGALPVDASRTRLRRRVGLAAASALIIGNTVGVGIFLTPVGMARIQGQKKA